jgi:hypothetical protein
VAVKEVAAQLISCSFTGYLSLSDFSLRYDDVFHSVWACRMSPKPKAFASKP